MSKKGFSMVIAFVLILGVLAGCGNKNNTDGASTSPSASVKPSESPAAGKGGSELSGTITASGSTALQPLVTVAATEFMKTNSKVTVQITGGGSGTGINNVVQGSSTIGNSDVEAPAEVKGQLVDHIVAIAPFALIVSKDVNVDSLTKQQAADIFMGKIKNWKEVGGSDLAIALVHRPDSSGSRKLVKKIILNDQDFSKDGVTQDSSKTVAEAVATGKGAIGYVDVPYITDKVKALKIDGNEYSADNIKSGKYILFGREHMYTKGEPDAATKAFLDFIVSKAFFDKDDVKKLGFLPADLVK